MPSSSHAPAYRPSARLRALVDAARTPSFFVASCATLLIVAIVRAAWLCEDAFITLRTVDNWINGHGLRWNPQERVQSFTHPLWLLVLTPAYWLTRDPGLGLVIPSIVTSLAFVWRLVHRRVTWLMGALILLLTASKAFVEFSSPGLENPLLHLLLATYAAFLSRTLWTGRGLWWVSGCVGLLLITRTDIVWLIAPSLAVVAWRARRELMDVRTWAALAPLLAWESFSLLYYGFPVPNTAYAKLSTGVPWEESVPQGLLYLKASVKYDPVTVATQALAVAFGLFSRRRGPASLAAGLVLWHVYLVSIGADFMLGRLLTPALVVAICILADTVPGRVRRWAPAAAAAVALASLALPRTPLWGAPRHVDAGWLPENVTDERALAYATNGVFRPDNPEGPAGHRWVADARRSVQRGERVLAVASVGMVGYFLGPDVHIVDQFGLCDPLLSRLPADPNWSPGHFVRHLPGGYIETLRSDRNLFTDAFIAERYAELRLITRERIFDRERLQAILKWNITRRVPFPPDFQVRRVSARELEGAPGEGAGEGESGVLATEAQGLAITLEPARLVRSATLTLSSDDRYRVALRRGDRVLYETWLAPASMHSGPMRRATVTPPEALMIDSLLVAGRQGDFQYYVGAVRFD